MIERFCCGGEGAVVEEIEFQIISAENAIFLRFQTQALTKKWASQWFIA